MTQGQKKTQVIIRSWLAMDPELRKTGNGKDVCSMLVFMRRPTKDAPDVALEDAVGHRLTNRVTTTISPTIEPTRAPASAAIAPRSSCTAQASEEEEMLEIGIGTGLAGYVMPISGANWNWGQTWTVPAKPTYRS